MAESTLWGTLVKWILIILVIVVTITVSFGKAGLFPKVVKMIFGAENLGPIAPSPDVTPDSSLPRAAISAQETFMGDISRYDGTGDCLLKFTPLSGLGSDLKLELINYNGVVQSRIEKPVGKGDTGSPKLNPLETRGKTLEVCVINPRTFYNSYLAEPPIKGAMTYIPVKSLILTKDSVVIDGTGYPINHGWIFKPEPGKACFIPTHKAGSSWGCEASDHTIDNDCIAELQKNIMTCDYKSIYDNFPECESHNGRCIERLEPRAFDDNICNEGEAFAANLKCPGRLLCCVPLP